jgi:Rps23 Pro-64 3,4-dihydroxylase Tpa1-like proline 4-hydroxylase
MNDLKKIAIECSNKIIQAKKDGKVIEKPYKHIVLDNFFPKELAEECLEAFPDLDSDVWDKSNDPDIEIKMRSTYQSEFDFPKDINKVVRIMNSSMFLKAMSEALDIPKLIPDPYYSGGGLNVTVSGGLLDVHVDGNYHDATGLNRRVNAILFLNPDWKKAWGGEYGVYDNKGEKLVEAVAPLMNRLVIFDTHDFSFHGVPNPIKFPEGTARRSVILYYYTKEPRPSSQISVEKPHSALWKKKNFTDKKGNVTREYQ